ncbi:MAG: GuaB3 family IMP dehydrogenase-related protein [Dehalococcoidia bacterium]|nr:GuaB3 family IMP dehydrogenase-related protein [Dehalococcoidia bacterium]
MTLEVTRRSEAGTPASLKTMRSAYGFDDVAIVPGAFTVNPELTNVSFSLGEFVFPIPIIAAALDAVTDPAFAGKIGRLGGLAVLNLEGIQTRYSDTGPIFEEIARAPKNKVTSILQKFYTQPIQLELIGKRVQQMKSEGITVAVSCTPANAKKFAPVAVEAGCDIFVVQSTVTTARHISTSLEGLRFEKFCSDLSIPVVVGNTVGYAATRELMEAGVAGILVGVGPGAICTSREVLGIGVPQVTATMDCAAARDAYYHDTGRYVPVITDGGIQKSGDLCKAIVAGADAVMLGSILAGTEEAPGRGNNWGMATPHAELPRGSRITIGVNSTLDRVLFGPTSRNDGGENLIGALRTAMGMCGARSIREFQEAELVIAPSIKTEGKSYQLAGLT